MPFECQHTCPSGQGRCSHRNSANDEPHVCRGVMRSCDKTIAVHERLLARMEVHSCRCEKG